jgi:hypothetical protein
LNKLEIIFKEKFRGWGHFSAEAVDKARPIFPRVAVKKVTCSSKIRRELLPTTKLTQSEIWVQGSPAVYPRRGSLILVHQFSSYFGADIQQSLILKTN